MKTTVQLKGRYRNIRTSLEFREIKGILHILNPNLSRIDQVHKMKKTTERSPRHLQLA